MTAWTNGYMRASDQHEGFRHPAEGSSVECISGKGGVNVYFGQLGEGGPGFGHRAGADLGRGYGTL